MKLFIPLISIALVTGTVRAQDAPVKPDTPRFQVGVQASVDHAYRTLALGQRSDISERVMNGRNSAEEARLGHSATLFMGYAFSSRFGLEVGIGHALRGWQLDISKLSFGDQIEPRRGYIYATHEELKAVRRDFHYLDIPVRGTLTFGKGPIRWITTAGVSINLLLKATSTVVLGDHSSTNVDGYRPIDLAAVFGTGLIGDVGRKGSIRIEPTLRRSLQDLRTDYPIAERLWSVGVMIGYTYRL